MIESGGPVSPTRKHWEWNFNEEKIKLIEKQKLALQQKIENEREALLIELKSEMELIRKEIPNNLLTMKLLDFFTLTDERRDNPETIGIIQVAQQPSVDLKRLSGNSKLPPGNSKRLSGNDKYLPKETVYVVVKQTPITKIRRVTRSMSKSSLIPGTGTNPIRDSFITETPKFHPNLPETPAAIRGRIKRIEKPVSNNTLEEVPRTSAIFDARPSTIRRVTRATIRPSLTQSSIPSNSTGQSRKREPESALNMGGTVSLETDDGKTIDLDISASPTTVVNTMEPSMVRDLGRLFKAYAAKMTAFYKKCKTVNTDR